MEHSHSFQRFFTLSLFRVFTFFLKKIKKKHFFIERKKLAQRKIRLTQRSKTSSKMPQISRFTISGSIFILSRAKEIIKNLSSKTRKLPLFFQNL